MKKLFGKEKGKTYTGADVDKALHQSNPHAFMKAVEEVYQAGGGTVLILKKKKKGDEPARQNEVDLEDVKAADNFLSETQKKYKNGLYLLRIFDKNKKQVSDHHFLLGGMEPEKKTGKKKKKKSSGSGGVKMKDYIKLTKAIKGNGSGDVSVSDLLQMQAQSFDRALQQQQQHTQTVLQMLSGGSSSIEELAALMELVKTMQPQLQPEEPLTAMLTSFAPLLGQLMAAKRAGGQDGRVLELENQLRREIAARAAAPGAVPDHPPPPGGSSSTGALGGQTAAAPAPVFAAGTHEYFDQRFIKPFQRDVAEEKPADELAYAIVSMVQYARDRMPDFPPLLVADFLKAQTIADHVAALDKFFGAIPELSNLTQKQLEIKGVLMQMFTGTPDTPGEVFAEESETILEEERSAPIIHINEDQTVEQGEIQDAADREFIREDGSEEAREVEDQSDGDGAGSEIDHETVPGRVG